MLERASEPDPCAQHGGFDSCCTAGCIWLEPDEGFAGACVSVDRSCAGEEPVLCEPGQVCYGQTIDVVPGTCDVSPLDVVRSGGICLDECPVGASCFVPEPE